MVLMLTASLTILHTDIVEMFLGTATLGAVIPYFAAYATGQLPLNDAYIAHFSDLTTIGPQCFILVITMIMITIEYSILVESHRLYGAKNNRMMACLPFLATAPHQPHIFFLVLGTLWLSLLGTAVLAGSVSCGCVAKALNF